MVTVIDDKISNAKRCLQTGKVKDADAVLKSILKVEPQHFDALHLSGIANLMQGKLDAASDYFQHAIEIDPQAAKAHHNLGLVHNARKDFERAVECFQRAFELDSSDAETSCALGDSLAALGRHERAVESYKHAIALDGSDAEAHGRLAATLGKLGRLDEAVDHFQKAIELAPGNAKFHNNLGSALGQLGRAEEAVDQYRKAIELDPDYDRAHSNLGSTLGELGRPDEALAHLRKAVELNPDYAHAHNNLGTTLRSLKQLDEAVVHYRRAIKLQPGYAEAYNNLGTVLSQSGQQDEAVKQFRKAIELQPGYAEAHSNLGTALSEMGQLEEGVAHYRKAIQINPEFAEAYRQLAFSKTQSEYNEGIKAMERLFEHPGTPDKQKVHLAFGLGKAFEDLEVYDKAFEFFAAGNALKRKSISFDLKAWSTHFEQLKKIYSASLFKDREGGGCADDTPIFVLGMPRSGTTLVEQILASHPDVYAAGELDVLSRTIAGSFDEKKYPQEVCDASDKVVERIGSAYIDEVKKRAHGHRFITDKLPHNFIHIGMIKLALPNAKIIHCTRDPKDTCLSIFKTYFTAQDHAYAYDLSELGRYYMLYLDLMAHWQSVLPDFIHDIAYEDVVADQESQTRHLLDICDLEWDDACLNFHETKRTVKTASAAQVRRPIYKSSVQSWKRYEGQLAPLIKVLK